MRMAQAKDFFRTFVVVFLPLYVILLISVQNQGSNPIITDLWILLGGAALCSKMPIWHTSNDKHVLAMFCGNQTRTNFQERNRIQLQNQHTNVWRWRKASIKTCNIFLSYLIKNLRQQMNVSHQTGTKLKVQAVLIQISKQKTGYFFQKNHCNSQNMVKHHYDRKFLQSNKQQQQHQCL